MAAGSENDEHVIINVEDDWYKIPLSQMAGYRVDASDLGVDLGADDEVAGFGYQPPITPDAAGFPGDSLNPGRAFPGDTLNPGTTFPGDSLSPVPPYRRGSAFFPGGAAGPF